MHTSERFAIGLTTAELAHALKLQPETLHKRHHNDGCYYNLVPKILPNRRLLWPLDSLELLTSHHVGHGK
jgi:hypothetical protein